jgi:ribosome biogenesis protein Nip4
MLIVSLLTLPVIMHPQYKVWVKPSSEMSFLYGNNVVKSGLGRMTEGIPKYAGVVVYSMTDIPLGESDGLASGVVWPASDSLGQSGWVRLACLR